MYHHRSLSCPQSRPPYIFWKCVIIVNDILNYLARLANAGHTFVMSTVNEHDQLCVGYACQILLLLNRSSSESIIIVVVVFYFDDDNKK